MLIGAKGTDYYVPIRARRSLVELIEGTRDLRFFDTILRLSTDDNTDITVRRSAQVALKPLLYQILQDGLVSQFLQNQNKALKNLLLASNRTVLFPLPRSRGLSVKMGFSDLSPHRKDIELTVAMLKALEQVGDESVISLVKILAIMPPAIPETFNSIEWTYQHQVHEAAERCLACLELRAKEAKQTQTLLRPSISPADGQSLLHPTFDSPNIVTSEQLLRTADFSGTQAQGDLLKSQIVVESAPAQEQRLNTSSEES